MGHSSLLGRYEHTIRPTARELAAVRKQAGVLIETATAHAGAIHGIINCRVMGSVERGTALKPIKDVDVLVVFSRESVPHATSNEFLAESASRLASIFPDLRVNLADYDLHLPPSFELPLFELVPALPEPRGGYLIAGPRGSWISTDPSAKAVFTAQRDHALAGTFRPVVRLLKRWRDALVVPVNSWHLEAMAGHLYHQPIESYEKAIIEFFKEGQNSVDIPDPDGVGGRFKMSYDTTAKTRFSELLNSSFLIATADHWTAIMGATPRDFADLE